MDDALNSLCDDYIMHKIIVKKIKLVEASTPCFGIVANGLIYQISELCFGNVV